MLKKPPSFYVTTLHLFEELSERRGWVHRGEEKPFFKKDLLPSLYLPLSVLFEIDNYLSVVLGTD